MSELTIIKAADKDGIYWIRGFPFMRTFLDGIRIDGLYSATLIPRDYCYYRYGDVPHISTVDGINPSCEDRWKEFLHWQEFDLPKLKENIELSKSIKERNDRKRNRFGYSFFRFLGLIKLEKEINPLDGTRSFYGKFRPKSF